MEVEMTGAAHEQLHAIVHGRVQGVNFRYYTTLEAIRLGLAGWVRNRPDRTVEVRAEGSRSSLEALLQFLHRGPPSARVEKVSVEWLPATNQFRGFDVLT
jgi:acylphosphatase